MENTIDKMIKIIHILLILLLFYIPFFSKNKDLNILYCIIIPFIVMHWILKQNICVCTILEKRIFNYFNINSKYYFMHKLFNGIYDATNNLHQISLIFLYIFIFSLWIICFNKILPNNII